MQPLNITSKYGRAKGAAAGTAYTTAQVTNLINANGGLVIIDWRFDLLHSDLSAKSDVTRYFAQATIHHDSEQAVHRTMQIDMADTVASQTVTFDGTGLAEAGIDYLNDRIQPWFLLGVPGSQSGTHPDGEWLHYPQGVFMFQKPGVVMPGYAVQRHGSMADLTYIVQQAQATSDANGAPFALPAGVALTDIVYHLLTNSPSAAGTGTNFDIPVGAPTLTNIPGLGIPTGRVGTTQWPWPTSGASSAVSAPNYTFSEGTAYLDMVNQMLFWAGYENLWCDENGNYCTQVRPLDGNYSANAVQWTFDTTSNSIVDFGGTQDFNQDEIVNMVQVIVEDPSRATFYASSQITNTASPLHASHLGRIAVKTIRDPAVPDTTSINWAQVYSDTMLRKSSYLVDTVTLPVSPVPGFQNMDVIALNIYESFSANGAVVNWPIIVGASTPNTTPIPYTLPGLVSSTEKFVVTAWEIHAILPPLGAQAPTGPTGVTTDLAPTHSKQGHTMSVMCHRTTSLS